MQLLYAPRAKVRKRLPLKRGLCQPGFESPWGRQQLKELGSNEM